MQQRHGEEEQGTRGRLGNRMVMPADWRAAADLDRLLCARLLTDLLGCGVRASTASAAVLCSSRAEQLAEKRAPSSLHAGVVGVEVESSWRLRRLS